MESGSSRSARWVRHDWWLKLPLSTRLKNRWELGTLWTCGMPRTHLSPTPSVALLPLFSLTSLWGLLLPDSSNCPLLHFSAISFCAITRPPCNDIVQWCGKRLHWAERHKSCLVAPQLCTWARCVWIWASVSSLTTRESHRLSNKPEGCDQWPMRDNKGYGWPKRWGSLFWPKYVLLQWKWDSIYCLKISFTDI